VRLAEIPTTTQTGDGSGFVDRRSSFLFNLFTNHRFSFSSNPFPSLFLFCSPFLRLTITS
jgi:hypothetical protein